MSSLRSLRRLHLPNSSSTTKEKEYKEALRIGQLVTDHSVDLYLIDIHLRSSVFYNDYDFINSNYIKHNNTEWIVKLQEMNLNNNIGTGIRQIVNNSCFLNAALQYLCHHQGYLKCYQKLPWHDKLFQGRSFINNRKIIFYVLGKTIADYYLSIKLMDYYLPSLFWATLKSIPKYGYFNDGRQHDVHEFLMLFKDDMRNVANDKIDEKTLVLNSYQDRTDIEDTPQEHIKKCIKAAEVHYGNTLNSGSDIALINLFVCNKCGIYNCKAQYPVGMVCLKFPEKENENKENENSENNKENENSENENSVKNKENENSENENENENSVKIEKLEQKEDNKSPIEDMFPINIERSDGIHRLLRDYCKWENTKIKCFNINCDGLSRKSIRFLDYENCDVMVFQFSRYHTIKEKITDKVELTNWIDLFGISRSHCCKCIIAHSGPFITSGHYFNYIYKNNIWYKYDDHNRVEKECVGELSNSPNYEFICRNAYIVMYKKVDGIDDDE